MATACFLLHDSDGTINDAIALFMLGRLFSSIIWLFMSMLVPILASVSCAIDDTIGIICADAKMASHHQKSCCTLFYHPDLRNTMMTLVMPSTSHDANVSHNGTTSPKWPCCTSFLMFWQKEWNDIINATIGFMWCWHQCQCHQWLRHWCQQCHMTKIVMLHLISVILM